VSIKHWIKQNAAKTPNKVAIHFQPESQQLSFSYAQLDQSIDQTVKLFHRLNLRPGERIAWYGMNHPEMLVLLFAAAHCRLILVPLNWRLAIPEVAFIVADCAPSLVFFDVHFAGNIRELLSDQANCRAIPINDPAARTFCAALSTSSTEIQSTRLSLFDTKKSHIDSLNSACAGFNRAGTPKPCNHACPTSLNALREDAQTQTAPVNDAEVTGNTPLMIVYTSGTTGRPKGAVLDQQSFQCNALMSHDMHQMSKADHVLSFLPMFHVGGFNIQMLPALALGATVTLMERFEPSEVIHSLNTQSISLAVCVPTILQTLLQHPHWDASKLHALRALAIGSTDVPLTLIQAIHQQGIPLLQVYGTTESSPLAIYQKIDNAQHTEGSIGQAGLLCEIRLVDAQGKSVVKGENGEIWVKGDNVLSHYWNNPKASQHALVDGWFRSGDVARCDEQGFYWFADRLKHVIISGGENIYAAELERVLHNFAGIHELAIVGKANAKWGEVAVVVAVRSSSNSCSDDELAANILQAFHGKIARYKHPHEVIFVDALPRTALGKVQADQVKALLDSTSTTDKC